MKFQISTFEVRKFGEDKWREIPEKIVLEKLVDCFDPVTPAITKMLEGNELITHQEIYRIRS